MKSPPATISDFVKSTPEEIRAILSAQVMIYAAIPFDYSTSDPVSFLTDALNVEGNSAAELCIRVCGVMDYVVGKSSGSFGQHLEDKAIEENSTVLGNLAKEQPSKDAAFAIAKASWQILRDNDLSIASLQQFESRQMGKNLRG